MNGPAGDTPRLGPIQAVTFTAADLEAVAEAYGHYLDYREIERGRVAAKLAEAWGAAGIADRPYRLLAPAAGGPGFFRVIEAPPDPAYRPFSTWGWNAAELIVRRVDELADRLAGSPFRIVGEPQDLSFSSDIRAMQVLGPGQELLYLTEFKRPVPGLDVPEARCAIDRTFIVIVAGARLNALQDFYASEFGVQRAAPVESRVKGMSAAFGLPPEQRYRIAALPLAGQCLIEVDEMPPAAGPRPCRPGELPAGIAIVSFAARAAAPEISPAGALYSSAGGAAIRRGAAGELLEILPA